ncbi:MAG: plastocyanin/azurin family copper-binding protein [Gemmatimonadales bacterium]
MLRIRLAVLGSLTCAFALASPAIAQDATPAPATPHTIVIKLVERAGPTPFAFEPATFSAQRGDTLRFVQFAATMHNVHFKTMPKGSKLGSAAISSYLTTKGQAYSVVVDSRFAVGNYEIVCDPHELVGMHAILTVTEPSVAAASSSSQH